MLRGLILALLTCAAFVRVAADDRQDLDTVNTAVAQFLHEQLSSYGDRASFQLGKLDTRLALAPCAKLDVELPNGSRLVGNTSLRVRCIKGARWAVNLPVSISIQTEYWVAARPLAPGHELTEGDIEQRMGNMAELPATVVLDYNQALGRTLLGGVPVGAPLRGDQLRAPFVVKANEFVKVIAHGSGFEVTSEGKALSNANSGERVTVKMASGAVVQGTAREDGQVEIKY